MSSAISNASFGLCSTSTIDKPALLELADRRHHLGNDLRRQALRRLVHQQHARIGHQRAADGEHLLLAAGQIARDLVRRSASRGNMAKTVCLGPRRMAAAGVLGARRDHQVFAHGQALETRGGLAAPARRRAPRSFPAAAASPAAPNTSTLPARGGSSPTLTFMQVDLPAPLRPEQPEQTALAERERHLLQHVAIAVIGVDVGEAKRASRQDRPPGCAGRPPLRRGCLRRSPRRSAAA